MMHKVGLLAIAVVACAIVAMAFRPSRAAHQSLYERIHRLRTVERNYEAARLLALEFLNSYRELDMLRQLIHFEYAATYYSEGRYPEAEPELQNLLDEFANVPISIGAADCHLDDAKFYIGVIQTIDGRYPEARETHRWLRDNWSESNRTIMALQFVNRAYIHEELDAWEPVRAIPPQAGAIEYRAEIEDNVATLVAQYPDSEECIAALLDLINYHSKRGWWNREGAAIAKTRIPEIARLMIMLAPDSRTTLRASVDLAVRTWREDPDGAMALLDSAISEGRLRDDESLYVDATFNYARLLRWAGDPARARAVWEELLLHDLSTLLEGEIYIFTSFTYTDEGDYITALDLLSALAEDERYEPSVRSTALVFKASALRRLCRIDDMLRTLDEVERRYPDIVAAETARFCRENSPDR